MKNQNLRHLKTDAIESHHGGGSRKLLVSSQTCSTCEHRNTGFTFTSAPVGYRIYLRANTNKSEQQPPAIRHRSGPASAIGRAQTHHTTTIMTTQQNKHPIGRPSDLRHGRPNAENRTTANQREKATRDGSPGNQNPTVFVLSPRLLISLIQIAAPLFSRAYPSTRRATSHASNHTTTHGCHAA
jgi:hypothetical protein